MKYLGRNIVNSDDVSLVGSTEETLTDVVKQINLLKGNIKWLYQHTKNVNLNIQEPETNKFEFLTLDEYDLLVENSLIDPETIYFTEEE